MHELGAQDCSQTYTATDADKYSLNFVYQLRCNNINGLLSTVAEVVAARAAAMSSSIIIINSILPFGTFVAVMSEVCVV